MNRTFEAMGAMGCCSSFLLTGLDDPEQLSGANVTAEFFRVLGASPVVGRTFAPGEDDPGASRRIAVLAHDFWVRRFASDPSVVGRALVLDGRTYRVIGVLPRGRPWLDAADVFVPLVRRPDANRGSFEISVIGRLRRGVTFEAALGDLESIARRLAELYPAADKGMGIRLEPSSRWIASDTLRRALWILMGGAGFLLAHSASRGSACAGAPCLAAIPHSAGRSRHAVLLHRRAPSRDLSSPVRPRPTRWATVWLSGSRTILSHPRRRIRVAAARSWLFGATLSRRCPVAWGSGQPEMVHDSDCLLRCFFARVVSERAASGCRPAGYPRVVGRVRQGVEPSSQRIRYVAPAHEGLRPVEGEFAAWDRDESKRALFLGSLIDVMKRAVSRAFVFRLIPVDYQCSKRRVRDGERPLVRCLFEARR